MKQSTKLAVKGFSLALCIIMVLTAVVSAAPLKGATTKTLSTNYTLVNLGEAKAIVTAEYYKSDGSTWVASATHTDFEIEANFGQKILSQYAADSGLSSGKGSVVLSSSEALGAVVQIQARNQVPSNGAYSGIASPSNKYYVPQVFRNLPSANGAARTQIIIQNTADTPTSVSINFIPFPGITGLSSYTNSDIVIPGKSSYYYEVIDETNLTSGSGTGSAWTGSAVVTAETDKKIAVIANTFAGTNSLMTYNAFPEENVSTSWEVPQFTSKLSNGLNATVIVQNLSGATLLAGHLQMDCTNGTISINKVSDKDVPDNGLFNFAPYNTAEAVYPSNFSGACTVKTTNSENIVVLVQLRRPGKTEEFAAYEGIPSNSTDTRVVVPLVSKNQSNGFATYVTIKNLDPINSADITLTYAPSATYVTAHPGAVPIVYDKTITGGGSLFQSQRFGGADGTELLPNGWYGTLYVTPKTGTTARPIAALVQLTNTIPQAGDTFMTHLAFTLP